MWPYGDSGLLHWIPLDVSRTRTNPEVFAPPWLWLSQRGSHFLDSCHRCRTSPTDKPAQGTSTPSACGAAGDSTGKTTDVHTCLAELSMEIESNFSQEAPDVGQLNSYVGPRRAQLVDEDLQAAVDFFKMPPPLLSPVPSPPLASLPPWGSLASPLGPVSATHLSVALTFRPGWGREVVVLGHWQVASPLGLALSLVFCPVLGPESLRASSRPEDSGGHSVGPCPEEGTNLQVLGAWRHLLDGHVHRAQGTLGARHALATVLMAVVLSGGSRLSLELLSLSWSLFVSQEACFEDDANSSDADSALHRNPPETISEDDSTSPLPLWAAAPSTAQGHNSLEEENLGAQEGSPSPSTPAGSPVPSVGFGTFAAPLSAPSLTFPFAQERPWASASESPSVGPADARGAVREVDKAVQTERSPLWPRDGEFPRLPILGSPLHPRSLGNLWESRPAEWMLASRVTSESEHLPGGDRGLPRPPAPAGFQCGKEPSVPIPMDSPLSESRFHPQLESLVSWEGESDPETMTSSALTLGSGVSPSEGRSDAEPAGVASGRTQDPSPPRSVLSRAPADGQHVYRSPQGPLRTSLCQPAPSGQGLGQLQLLSWHQSPVLRRGRAGGLPDTDGPLPCPAAAISPDENLGAAVASATLPSNQVSVITKQARPDLPTLLQEDAPLTAVGPLPRTELQATERDGVALRTRQAVATTHTSPEVSSTCRKLDFDDPSAPSVAGSSLFLASSILALSYDHVSGHKHRGTLGPRRLPAPTRAVGQSPRKSGPSPLLSGGTSGAPQTVLHPENLPMVPCLYTGRREPQDGVDTEAESEVPSCSEGEPEPETSGAVPGTAKARSWPELGALMSALQHCSLAAAADSLSTSDVALFLEGCRLRDSSCADSASECSSKEPVVALEEAGGGPEPPEELPASEGNEAAPRLSSQLSPSSLDTLAKVLARLGRELQAGPEGSPLREAGTLLLLNMLQQIITEEGPNPEPESKPHPEPEPDPEDPEHELHPEPEPEPEHELHPEPELEPVPKLESKPEPKPVPDSPLESIPASKSASAAASLRGSPDGQSGPAQQEARLEPAGSQSTGTGALEAEPEAMFQCQISTVTSEVISVLLDGHQDLVIEKGDNWTIINGVALLPGSNRMLLCCPPAGGLDTELDAEPEAGLDSDLDVDLDADVDLGSCPSPAEDVPPAPPEPVPAPPPSGVQEISSSGQTTNFDKSRLRNRPVRPSTRINAEIFDHDLDFEAPTAASDHTYFNSKLEVATKTKGRARNTSREQSSRPGKVTGRTEAPGGCDVPEEKSPTKAPRVPAQPVLATADTSTPADGAAGDTLSQIRQEVGPPLPPLLAPLVATPPRPSRSVSPLISSSSPTSPLGQLSPLSEAPEPPAGSPIPGTQSATGERALASPLQFCAATPKHALPVPGRLPPLAAGPTSAHTTSGAGPQENSVKILDTMYPELSARARTLNILKGNLQLARGPADGQDRPAPGSTLSGFKTITSTSTAFVKAGGRTAGKRALLSASLRSAKKLRLDGSSPEPESGSTDAGPHRNHRRQPPPSADYDDNPVAGEDRGPGEPDPAATQAAAPKYKDTAESHDGAIADALKRLAQASFDLLPVIRSHVYVGNISKRPVMRDQEKEVVLEFSTTRKVGSGPGKCAHSCPHQLGLVASKG